MTNNDAKNKHPLMLNMHRSQLLKC